MKAECMKKPNGQSGKTADDTNKTNATYTKTTYVKAMTSSIKRQQIAESMGAMSTMMVNKMLMMTLREWLSMRISFNEKSDAEKKVMSLFEKREEINLNSDYLKLQTKIICKIIT